MLSLLLLSCTHSVAALAPAPAPAPALVTQPATQLDDEDPVHQLYAAAGQSTVGYQRLRYLSDQIGNRSVGSDSLDAAEAWAADQLRADGFTPRLEPVEVPVWQRGAEAAQLLSPVVRSLPLIGLGHTLATPPEGIEANVLVVSDLDALRALPPGAADGQIVLLDQPFTTYGETVQGRIHGPQIAADKGALAFVLRSVTSHSLDTPHTGMTGTDPDQARVPAAALTIEDASWLHRLSDAGVTPRLRLSLDSQLAPPATQHNIIAELAGRSLPDEIVVIGCHLDSWDVGQGAQDDGAGCVIAWEGLRLIAAADQAPRRTVRLVLFTSEEVGGQGGDAYALAHSGERHVALIESDTGNGRASGLRVDLDASLAPPDTAVDALSQQLAATLLPLGGGSVERGYSGTDVRPVVAAQGAIGLGLDHDQATYWPIHHTAADTFDKVVLADLQHNAGLMAAAAWWLAERPADEPAFQPVEQAAAPPTSAD